jgi:hypothetical protein
VLKSNRIQLNPLNSVDPQHNRSLSLFSQITNLHTNPSGHSVAINIFSFQLLSISIPSISHLQPNNTPTTKFSTAKAPRSVVDFPEWVFPVTKKSRVAKKSVRIALLSHARTYRPTLRPITNSLASSETMTSISARTWLPTEFVLAKSSPMKISAYAPALSCSFLPIYLNVTRRSIREENLISRLFYQREAAVLT